MEEDNATGFKNKKSKLKKATETGKDSNDSDHEGKSKKYIESEKKIEALADKALADSNTKWKDF